MMEIEEAMRLVPELNGMILRLPTTANPEPDDVKLVRLLLTTRHQLEIAIRVLEYIRDQDLTWRPYVDGKLRPIKQAGELK